MRASSGVPGVFSPVEVDGRTLVDGGLVNPIHIAPTLNDTIDLTIAVNLNSLSEAYETPNSFTSDSDKAKDQGYRKKITRFLTDKFGSGDSAQESPDAAELLTKSIDVMQGAIARLKLAAYALEIVQNGHRHGSRWQEAARFIVFHVGGNAMSYANYQPWFGVRQLQDDINRLFSTWSTNDSSGVTADWVPNVDINEFEDRFQLFIDIPGVNPKDVEITLETGVLTISGERYAQAEKEGEQVIRRRNERGSGRFYRQFILPETVDADKVKAADRHGVLDISIPKQAKAQPRRIKVAA